MLTLYDDVFSPYARKVRLALYEKEIPFDRVRALHGDCNRSDFLHVNPRAEVPALIDDETQAALYDSTIICEYLEDRYRSPALFPGDARARAKCRLVEDIADTQLDAALYAVTVVELGRREVHAAMHEAAGRDIERLYGVLEELLGDHQFFCGAFSIADLAVVPHFLVATFLGFAIDPAQHPALARWLDAAQSRPSVMRDNADVLGTLQRLQAEQRAAFDPYRVQWRSDRLEWVIKNGFAEWFMDEMRAGRAFFPLPIRAAT
jgi:glutathione S-transferase